LGGKGFGLGNSGLLDFLCGIDNELGEIGSGVSASLETLEEEGIEVIKVMLIVVLPVVAA
jgi:hypothetical protein